MAELCGAAKLDAEVFADCDELRQHFRLVAAHLGEQPGIVPDGRLQM